MSFYTFARSIVKGFCKIAFHITYEGLEHVPEGGGYIIAANHRTLLDPIFVAQKLKRPVNFMAKDELFRFPLGIIIKGLGAFPVKRGTGDSTAIQTAIDVLEQNKILAMFPEGTRSKTGVPLKPKSGIALIISQTKASVLPVGISFSGKLGFRKKITVRYGEMISAEELQMSEKPVPSELKRTSRLVMDRIISLVDLQQIQPADADGSEK